MEKVLVLATSFLDDLMTHPVEEGKASRMLYELAEGSDGSIEIEYRCDRDRTIPLRTEELAKVAAIISDLELYSRELLQEVGATGYALSVKRRAPSTKRFETSVGWVISTGKAVGSAPAESSGAACGLTDVDAAGAICPMLHLLNAPIPTKTTNA